MKPQPPLLPVFLPAMLVLGCLCMPTAPLLSVSSGKFGLASLMMNCGGSIACLVMTAGLALTRAEKKHAKYVRWIAHALACGVAAWIVIRLHLLTTNALAGADEESRRTMMAYAESERPWVFLAAVLSLVPTVLGGIVGARLIKTAKARSTSDT